MKSTSTWRSILNVAAAMSFGGLCATAMIALVGPAILWYLAPVSPTSVLLTRISAALPGGHGILRRLRGTGAIVLALAGLFGSSLCFCVVYRLMLAVIAIAPAPHLAVQMGMMLAMAVLMDFCFASELVGTLAAVCRSEQASTDSESMG